MVQKITHKLGLTELWNSNGVIIGPSAYDKATCFVERYEEQVRLAFGFTGGVKKILYSWGGHELKVITRVRKRRKRNAANTLSPNTVRLFCGPLGCDLGNAKRECRTLRKSILAIFRSTHVTWRANNPPIRVDESIRQIQSPPWNLLRHPNIPT